MSAILELSWWLALTATKFIVAVCVLAAIFVFVLDPVNRYMTEATRSLPAYERPIESRPVTSCVYTTHGNVVCGLTAN